MAGTGVTCNVSPSVINHPVSAVRRTPPLLIKQKRRCFNRPMYLSSTPCRKQVRIKNRLYLYEPHSRDRLRRLIISCSLQKVRTDLLRRRRRKVDGSHVKDGDRARAAFFAHAGDCPGIGCENRACELGVGIKLSSLRLYSMTWVCSLSMPVTPLRMTLPPWGRPE